MAGAGGQQLRLSLGEEATCPICLGYFAEPVSVHCGHTFCTPCITRYWETLQGPYTCPQCWETALTCTLRPNRQLASIVQILAQGPPPAHPISETAEQNQRWQRISDEVTCPICLGYFAEPVSVQCGHTFCTPCITSYMEKVYILYRCPQCRETAPTNTIRPNHKLASIVQIVAKWRPVAPPMEDSRDNGAAICTEHGEKLNRFCVDDHIPICVICWESQDHEDHTVRPIPEAAREYKVNFKSQRKQIARVFNMVQQFLEKEKHRHLSNLEEKEKRALQEIREKLSELDTWQSSVGDQITQIELKCQQPDVEFLKDENSISSRFEQLENLPQYSGSFKEQEEGPDKDEKLMKVKEEKENKKEQEDVKEADIMLMIIESLEWRWARCHAGDVTLDPDTAHWDLDLSEDRRSVSLGDRTFGLPDTPERFNSLLFVLGRNRLKSGSHYWEVEVGDKRYWTLGVCNESVSRNGEIRISPEDGYWAVELGDHGYAALSSPSTPLTPSVPPRVVGLFLDYEAGRFSVYNVTDRSLLFTFPRAPFPRTLRPLFDTAINGEGDNGRALRILPLTEQKSDRSHRRKGAVSNVIMDF